MGFNDWWIKWIRICVESVSFSMLVNHERVGPVIPGRGLWQGDPLSLNLFILCSEGLIGLINKAGDVHGITICQVVPTISYILFADECFFF